jgi:hypothetical protein
MPPYELVQTTGIDSVLSDADLSNQNAIAGKPMTALGEREVGRLATVTEGEG